MVKNNAIIAQIYFVRLQFIELCSRILAAVEYL